MSLSKSEYMLGLQCEKALWLKRRRPELASEPDAALERVFEQGREVGELARTRFPGGRLIGRPRDTAWALAETRRALAEGATTLFEAAFEFEGAAARVDVLRRAEDGWELVEVKSATRVEDTHLRDAAFQARVLAGAGLKPRKVFLLHLDGRYVRSGPLDVQRLFLLEDVSAKTAALQKGATEDLARLAAVSVAPEAPEPGLGRHCRSPYPCRFSAHCWSAVPEYSVHDLARISEKKLALLAQRGIMRVADVPDDFPLSDAQRAQVDMEKSGRERLDVRAVRELLSDLEFPLHFLDFETVNPALPPYDGLRPYAQLPFQASVRVQAEAGAEASHLEFLGDGRQDPRRALAAFLASAIAPRGSVVAFNAGFESRCLDELAPYATPEQGTRLLSAQRRLWDLGEPFAKGYFAHPAFRGRWSIKAVLPALVPGMGYEGLAIKDGGQAQLAYLEMMSGAAPERAARLSADLRAYCGQDTLAMVRLLESLRARLGGA